MIRLLIVLLLVAAKPALAETEISPWQTEVLKSVKSEKTVLDAYWRSPENNILHVSREFDGTRHDGFAQYLCSAMRKGEPPEGLKFIWIYDPYNYERAKTKSGEQMGMAACR